MRARTKHGIQGGVLLLVAVLAHSLPGWWASWQLSCQADREFRQAHYSVIVYCTNCRGSSALWREKGKGIEGMKFKCGPCGVLLSAGPKGVWGWVRGIPVERSENDDKD